MTINTEAIMQGRTEVSLGEAYSVLKSYGLYAPAVDSTYQKLSCVQRVALFALGMSLMLTLFGGAFSIHYVTALNSIGQKMMAATLGFSAAAGLVALAAFCAKHYHLCSTKLNAAQANELLKNVKRAVEKRKADYLVSPHYKTAQEYKKHLTRLAERIEPDYQVQ